MKRKYLAALILALALSVVCLPRARAAQLTVSATVLATGGVEISWSGDVSASVFYDVTGTDGFAAYGADSPVTDPQGAAGTRYTVTETDDVQGVLVTVASQTVTASATSPVVGGNQAPKLADFWDIFTPAEWALSLQWYETLALLSGVFIFLAFLRAGYQYLKGQENPAGRADVIAQGQRVFVALVVIAVMPVGINALISANDGFVRLFANMLSHYTTAAAKVQPPVYVIGRGLFEDILTWPLTAVVGLCQKLLGLRGIDTIIFNGYLPGHLFSNFATATYTQDPFSDAIVKLALLGFQVFFNALFTIRKWVVTACFVATPLLIWVWVITEEIQVIEILLAEIISSIFMQSAYALAFAIFFSLLAGPPASAGGIWPNTGNAVHGIGLSALAWRLVVMGEFAAGIAGAVAFVMMVVQGFRLITAENEQVAAGAYAAIRRIVFGVFIVGGSLAVAGLVVNVMGGA